MSPSLYIFSFKIFCLLENDKELEESIMELITEIHNWSNTRITDLELPNPKRCISTAAFVFTQHPPHVASNPFFCPNISVDKEFQSLSGEVHSNSLP